MKTYVVQHAETLEIVYAGNNKHMAIKKANELQQGLIPVWFNGNIIYSLQYHIKLRKWV